jgi:hypothetical protein
VLQDFEYILAVLHKVQQTMSRESTPILVGSLPAFEMFMTAWEALGEKNPHLQPFINIGLEWAKKYYNQMDNTKAYIIAMGEFHTISVRHAYLTLSRAKPFCPFLVDLQALGFSVHQGCNIQIQSYGRLLYRGHMVINTNADCRWQNIVLGSRYLLNPQLPWCLAGAYGSITSA